MGISRRAVLALVFSALSSASLGFVALGCASESASLIVEARTGLVPGPEFASVETDVLRIEDGSSEVLVRSATAIARHGQPFVSGRRVAELEGIGSGTYVVRVSLIRPDGRTVLVRRSTAVVLEAGRRRVVRVVLDRGCVTVECPTAGGSPALSECLGGRCVDPRCEPPDPTHCGELFCNTDADCPGGPSCAEARCLDGVCELVEREEGDAACPDGTWCSVEAGVCRPLGSGADAGADGSLQCGTLCSGAPGSCEVGYWDCSTGTPVCQSFLRRPAGTTCEGGVCDARGECVSCPAGAPCREGCREGTVDCSAGSVRCTTGPASIEGAACEPDAVRFADLDDADSPFSCDAGGACSRRQGVSFVPDPVELRESDAPTWVTARATAPVRGGLSTTVRIEPGASRAGLVSADLPVRSIVVTIVDGANEARFAARALDDGVPGGPVPFTIRADTVTSPDPRFDGIELPILAGTVYDACAPGTDDCDGSFANGCEALLDTDTNCGVCGRACLGAVPSGVDRCTGGRCEVTCDVGTSDCNADLVDGCETPLGTSTDCARCGEVCTFPNASGACVAGPSCGLGTCTTGFSDCNTVLEDGCELVPGGSCTPIGQPCRTGTLSCNTSRGRPACTAGALLPSGTTCGAGGTCDAAGNCLCPAGTPANTPCDVDSICNGGTPNRCVRNAFWEAPGCSATPTGNSLCVSRGFLRATSAYGYSWSECGGPNASIGAVDNCLEYDASRARCVRWTPGTACNGVSLGAVRFGVALREYGGPPDHVFRITDFWGRGCPGWAPGYSIRVVCEL
jgi:hypothetical protein